MVFRFRSPVTLLIFCEKVLIIRSHELGKHSQSTRKPWILSQFALEEKRSIRWKKTVICKLNSLPRKRAFLACYVSSLKVDPLKRLVWIWKAEDLLPVTVFFFNRPELNSQAHRDLAVYDRAISHVTFFTLFVVHARFWEIFMAVSLIPNKKTKKEKRWRFF